MASTLSKVIRETVNNLNTTGRYMSVYNDKRKGENQRSVKVLGWKLADYEVAVERLRAQGFEVKLRKLQWVSPTSGKLLCQPRIHTTSEPTR